MAINATKLELQSCPQKYSNDLYNPASSGDAMFTLFDSEHVPCTWHSTQVLRLVRTDDAGNMSCSYGVDPNYHFLLYSYLHFNLPWVRVRKGKSNFRVAWCKNVGSNVVRQAEFVHGEQNYPGFDSVWLDTHFQWFLPQDRLASHDRCIGNVPALQEFSQYLPPHVINLEQPWFYSCKGIPGWPIFKAGPGSHHRYNFRPLRSLLRVEQDDGEGNWRNVTGSVNIDAIVEFGPGIDSQPEMWGKYALLGAAEYDSYMNCPENESKAFFIKDVVAIDSINASPYDTSCCLALESKTPCLAFFWSCSNVQAQGMHDYSNYTTDERDSRLGGDPVSATSLKYSNVYKFNKMPSDHFNAAIGRYHFPATPRDVGYHAYCIANDPSSGDGEVALVFGPDDEGVCRLKADLVVDLYNSSANSAPTFSSESLLDSEAVSVELPPVRSNAFRTHVRLLTTRKLTITKDKDSRQFNFRLE